MALATYALTTVADVKTFIGETSSTYDTLLEMLIDECTDWIEEFLNGRRLLCDANRDGTPVAVTERYNSNARRVVLLRKYPVIEITSVAYATGNVNSPTWNTLDATSQYTFDPTTGELFLVATVPVGVQNIRVVYKGGYVGQGSTGTIIPKNLVMACIRMVAKQFNKRRSQGIKNESVGGASITWEDDMDAEVKRTLNKYKRLSF